MRLPPRAAFALLASAALTLLTSSSAPTPLYATYQARWGFNDLTLTVIFGAYAVAVLVSLLVFGSLSDHVGRRPPLIIGLAAQALVMLVFAFAGNLDVLLAARVLQGIATGAALGAIGAGMVDLHPERGPVVNSSALMAGTASGSLLAALFVQFLPAPTELVYLVLGGVFALQAIGVFAISETSSRIPGAKAALMPTLALPQQVRGPVITATPILVAAWALGGFYASLGPDVAQAVAGSKSMILAGVVLFLLAGTASLAMLRFGHIEPRRFALAGGVGIIVGSGLLLVGIATRSLPVFLIGTFPAGFGFGAGFQGGLRTIVVKAEPHERAGVVSVAYVISYLSLGLPAILAGVLVVHSSLTQVSEELGAAVIALAALTTLGLAWTLRREAQQLATAAA
ncbi:MAG: MFS transporter [Solirubrobacterales bacterium]|nr:MFS transporter [Solirubrobacterales bacterium]